MSFKTLGCALLAGMIVACGLAESIPAPSWAQTMTEYVVQSSDTLLSIAIKFDTSTAALQALNRLSDPNMLRAGQVLKVPAPPTGAGSGTCVVQAGDTLGAIALRFCMSVDALARANRLTDLDKLRIGQQLIIPSAILEAAAQAHADDCAARGRCSHIGSDGSRASQRIARAGYASRFNGENWAWSRSADQAFDMWYTREIPTQGPH